MPPDWQAASRQGGSMGKDLNDAMEMTRRGALRQLGGTVAATGLALHAMAPALAQEATPAMAELPQGVPPDFKVVLHAAEEQNWQYVLSNLRNLTAEWPQAKLRVVADGSAVLNLQGESVITKALAEVAAKGVQLQVCPNALREHEIDPATIPSYAQTALGGVVALVLAHHEGYIYVKP
jgi:intracellular sulfur oxidation DsrE/DsrF family protein